MALSSLPHGADEPPPAARAGPQLPAHRLLGRLATPASSRRPSSSGRTSTSTPASWRSSCPSPRSSSTTPTSTSGARSAPGSPRPWARRSTPPRSSAPTRPRAGPTRSSSRPSPRATPSRSATRSSGVATTSASTCRATMGLVEDDGFDVTGFWSPPPPAPEAPQPARRQRPAALPGRHRRRWLVPLRRAHRLGPERLLEQRPRAHRGRPLGGHPRGPPGHQLPHLHRGRHQRRHGAVILNLMQQDAVVMRATFRVAFQVANPVSREAPDAATRFPFAVLLEEAS